MMRENEDADLRVGHAQFAGSDQSLVAVGRRHPDVDDDDVGLGHVDGSRQFDRVCDLADNLETDLGQEAREPLAQEQLVIRDHDAQGISAWMRWRPRDNARTETLPSRAPTRSSSLTRLTGPGHRRRYR